MLAHSSSHRGNGGIEQGGGETGKAASGAEGKRGKTHNGGKAAVQWAQAERCAPGALQLASAEGPSAGTQCPSTPPLVTARCLSCKKVVSVEQVLAAAGSHLRSKRQGQKQVTLIPCFGMQTDPRSSRRHFAPPALDSGGTNGSDIKGKPIQRVQRYMYVRWRSLTQMADQVVFLPKAHRARKGVAESPPHVGAVSAPGSKAPGTKTHMQSDDSKFATSHDAEKGVQEVGGQWRVQMGRGTKASSCGDRVRERRGAHGAHAIAPEVQLQNRWADVAPLDDADSSSGGRSSDKLGEPIQKQQLQQKSPRPAIADGYSRLKAKPYQRAAPLGKRDEPRRALKPKASASQRLSLLVTATRWRHMVGNLRGAA